MSPYHLKQLDRTAYIASVATIQDPRTVNFANLALTWWDRHFGWSAQGAVVLSDAEQNHLCYVFYKIDRYREYMNIHNIFTPLDKRRKGYAHALLTMIFDLAIAGHVGRFKLCSVSRSLDFYLSLGFVYWGVNSVGDYYCDLPIPLKGLESLEAMIAASDTGGLIGKNLEAIYAKVNGNDASLTSEQSRILERDKIKMGESYLLDELSAIKKLSA